MTRTFCFHPKMYSWSYKAIEFLEGQTFHSVEVIAPNYSICMGTFLVILCTLSTAFKSHRFFSLGTYFLSFLFQELLGPNCFSMPQTTKDSSIIKMSFFYVYNFPSGIFYSIHTTIHTLRNRGTLVKGFCLLCYFAYRNT